MNEAIVGVGAGICGSLVAFSAQGKARQFSVDVEGDGKAFSLAVPVELGGDCTDTGTASSPTLNRDGKTLAFLASPASVGLSGSDRLGTPSNIYILDVTTTVARLLVPGLTHAGELEWAPDGQELAFVGEVDGHDGMWRSDSQGELRQVGGPAHRLAWSPDGTTLFAAVLAGDQTDPFVARLELISLPLRPAESP